MILHSAFVVRGRMDVACAHSTERRPMLEWLLMHLAKRNYENAMNSNQSHSYNRINVFAHDFYYRDQASYR